MSLKKTKENISPPSSSLVHPKYRPDIDGLRAVAVLSVVAYHAFPSLLKGGFIGVDIFFVISGFLISTIIFNSLKRDSFSFYDFYSRRIRRIFPALLVVLISCYAFGWFALLTDEYKQLGKHIAAGAGFVSNFVLWSESGYFDTAAEAKPLLHLWSLGIEEQFYIVWPVLLWAAWKKKYNLFTISLVLFVVSFGLNLSKYRVDGVAGFYSPQTRFWELLAGSLLAYITHYRFQASGRIGKGLDSWLGKVFYALPPKVEGPPLRNALSLFGVLLMALGLALIDKERHFPGTWAILPVLGTVCIIAAGSHSWFNRIFLSNRLMVWFGIISFPLYLWHWPLLSYARIVEGEVPAPPIRITAVLLSIVLAWLTYKLIEHPLRFGGRDKLKVSFLFSMIALLGYVGYDTYQRDGLPFREAIQKLKEPYRLIEWRNEDNSDTVCQKHFGKAYGYCKLTDDSTPTVALIGDSFANSYFYGLSAQFKKSGDILVMLGSGGCPSMVDITSGFSGQGDWCKSMSSNAIKQVSSMPSIHTVILASNWHLYINGTRFHQRYDRKWEIRADNKDATNPEVFATQIKKTIDLLLSSGKNIIVLKQTPEINVDPASCFMRRPFSITEKKESRCEVSAAEVRSYLKEYESIFDKAVPQNNRVKILDPFSSLCSDTTCSVLDGRYPIYRDDLHLSRYGSIYFANRLTLPKFDDH